ncbi:uncharacterized protein LOC131631831 isoform X2 [Vicia villosa]|uniref:uncharacterized protein LOC131631831 isoform X2 n=1 Tax=Vicia villosa TaxID=3911 RepID=UPI00273C1A5F|nr:uncharacterized protein LOC131631831 isoform X2 [Vicia villosa]
MVNSISFFTSLPEDINFKIASLLQLWRQVCFSDSIWHVLLTNRWPLFHSPLSPNLKTWRRLYFERHIELGLRAGSVERFLKACSRKESLEVGDYLQAFEIINGARFGFEDIQRFLFKPEMNVLVNLVGVHYCITNLGIQGDNLVEVLRTCEISNRHVCVKWWKLGRWIYGYRGRDELLFRWVSLADLTAEENEFVLGVLRRGTVLEVLRVQISAVGHKSINTLVLSGCPVIGIAEGKSTIHVNIYQHQL